MITKEQKVRLSIFLVVAALLLVVILVVLIYPKLKGRGEIYFINFKGTSVNGLNQGADVKYQGVKIGIVSRIRVNPHDLNSILVYVSVDPEFPVTEDMRAALQYAGITGLRFVEISGGHINAKVVPPGGEISTKKGLGEKAEDIVLNVDSVVTAVNDMLNPENRQRFNKLMENLETSTRVIANVLEKKEAHLGNSLEKFDMAMTEVIDITTQLSQFARYMNEMSEKIPLESIAQDTQQLLRELNGRLSGEEMGKVIQDVDSFAKTATSSIRKIENRFLDLESELSRTLVSLRESLENISQFTRDLREDPTLFLLRRPEKEKKRRRK